MLSDEQIKELRDSIDLSRIKLVDNVKLQKRGNNLIGLCPSEFDKNDHLMLTIKKVFIIVFGCGAHGDII